MVDAGLLLSVMALFVAISSALFAGWQAYQSKKASDLQKQELDLHKKELDTTTERFLVEQELKKNEERQRNIREHVDRLIHRFDLHAFPEKQSTGVVYSIATYSRLGWARFALRLFDYKRELLEHLRTGHGEPYVLFTTTEILQKESFEAKNNLSDTIRLKVNEAAETLGLKKDFTTSFPSYNELEIASYILRRITGENLTDFEVVPPANLGIVSPNPVYNVVAGGTTVGFFGSNKKMGEDFATVLNKIDSCDAELQQAANKYVAQTQQIQSTDKEFDKQMDYFIHGKELEGDIFGGACQYCVRWRDEKEQPLLKAFFSQVDAFLSEKILSG